MILTFLEPVWEFPKYIFNGLVFFFFLRFTFYVLDYRTPFSKFVPSMIQLFHTNEQTSLSLCSIPLHYKEHPRHMLSLFSMMVKGAITEKLCLIFLCVYVVCVLLFGSAHMNEGTHVCGCMCAHALLQLLSIFYLLRWDLLMEATAHDKQFILWTISPVHLQIDF